MVFDCPHCQNPFDAPPGTTVICPHCNNQVTVPTRVKKRRSLPEVSEAVEKKIEKLKADANLADVAFAMSFVANLIATIAMATFCLGRPAFIYGTLAIGLGAFGYRNPASRGFAITAMILGGMAVLLALAFGRYSGLFAPEPSIPRGLFR